MVPREPLVVACAAALFLLVSLPAAAVQEEEATPEAQPADEEAEADEGEDELAEAFDEEITVTV